VRNLLKSRPGRAIVAIRDNETGAATSGVNLRFYKLMTFGVSAAVSGIGGCLFFLALNSVGPSSFDGQHTILLLMGLVVGGVATLHGAWLGGLVFVFLQDWASRVHATWIPYFRIEKGSQLTQVVFGLVLVLVAFFAPGGLMSLARRLKARIIRVVPKPPTRTAEPVPAAELSPLPAPANPLHIPSDQPART
jgi:branched-chain amino acid transport system permease protein